MLERSRTFWNIKCHLSRAFWVQTLNKQKNQKLCFVSPGLLANEKLSQRNQSPVSLNNKKLVVSL